jgi:hypothetical protein
LCITKNSDCKGEIGISLKEEVGKFVSLLLELHMVLEHPTLIIVKVGCIHCIPKFYVMLLTPKIL